MHQNALQGLCLCNVKKLPSSKKIFFTCSTLNSYELFVVFLALNMNWIGQ